MNKTEIEEIKNIFDSIICLAVEGPDATSVIVIINKIIKEAGRGYNLCDRHLPQQCSGQKQPSGYELSSACSGCGSTSGVCNCFCR